MSVSGAGGSSSSSSSSSSRSSGADRSSQSDRSSSTRDSTSTRDASSARDASPTPSTSTVDQEAPTPDLPSREAEKAVGKTDKVSAPPATATPEAMSLSKGLQNAPTPDAAPAAPAADAPPATPDAPAALDAPAADAPPAVDAAPAEAPPAGPGVLDAGFDPQNPPAAFDAEVTVGGVGKYAVTVNATNNEAVGIDGEKTVTLDITRTEMGGAAVPGKVGAVGVEGAKLEGTEVSYSVTMPAAEYEKVVAGDAPFPDPADLSTLPDGTTVTMRAEDLAQTRMGASLGPLSVGNRLTSMEGTSIGLQVQDGNVRVFAGPTEAVHQGIELGVGGEIGAGDFKVGGKFTVGASKTLRDAEMQFADLSKTEGQAAYESFLASGEVPAPGTEGVLNAGTIRQVDISQSNGIGGSVSLGALELNGSILPGQSVDGSLTEVTFADGRRELTGTVVEDGVTLFAETSFSAGGQMVDRRTGIVLDGVDQSFGGLLGESFGVDSQNVAHDAQVVIGAQEFDQWRERALDTLGRQGFDPATVDAIRNGQISGYDLPSTGNPVVNSLLGAQNVDEFLADPQLRLGNSNTLVNGLVGMYSMTSDQGPLAGELSLWDD